MRCVSTLHMQCGYLYLSDPQRLHDMMCLLGLGDDDEEGVQPDSDGSGGAAQGGIVAANSSNAGSSPL
jgi:hypothetical protein